MAGKLAGRVAIVTGSGRGIGQAISLALAKEGVSVVTNDVIPGSAEATAKKVKDIGGKAVPFTCDITKFNEAEKLIKTAADKFGKLDIMINNAGVTIHKYIWEFAEIDFDRVVGVSLKGTFNCSRHASALMEKQKWGRIINASSGLAFGAFRTGTYCAAKAGVIGLSRSIALDVATFGGTCNVYCPRAAGQLTPMQERIEQAEELVKLGQMTEKQKEAYLHELPPPEAIPPFIVYLCTDEGGNINGQVFSIGGGRISIYSEQTVKETINKEKGIWTLEELALEVPKTLLKGYKPPRGTT